MDALVRGVGVTARSPYLRTASTLTQCDMGALMHGIAQRFWSKVFKHPGEGCWEWTAARNPQSGYGVIRIGSKAAGTSRTETAHRVSWLLTHWLIPRGRFVLHKCDNRKCVRPDHLYIGTQQDNMRDVQVRGRHNNAYTINPPTHCKRGHEFNEQNTARDSKGNRRCRKCGAMWTRVYGGREERPDV